MGWSDKLWTASITVAPELRASQPSWQRRAIAVCQSRAFEILVISVIVLNAVTIGAQTYLEEGSSALQVLEVLDWPIVVFFGLELLVRFTAYGFNPRRFLANPWNVFDTIVVVVAGLPHMAKHVTVLRAVRLLRVARLLRIMPDVAVLMEGIRRAIAPAFSLGSIIALGTYIYAVLGYLLFADAVPERFGDIGEGMLTLFELLTLEGWNDILHDLRDASPYGLWYTIAFVICATYVVVNFVVGVIITSLEDAYEARRGVSEEDVMEMLRKMDVKIDSLQNEVDHLRRGEPEA